MSDVRQLAVALVAVHVLLGASRVLAQPAPANEAARVEELRGQAAAALGRGEWTTARALFDELLTLTPHDPAVQRDAGRAGMAAGDFAYAARVLDQAHHDKGHHRDPELHYLRGEALFALGNVEEARAEHRICELEMGNGVLERMSKLRLARIYTRRGEIERADAVYESLWPTAGAAPDPEVALNHAEAHLLLADWAGAERLLRRFLAQAPDNLRARHMLAWALESRGDLPSELSVRAPLAADDPASETQRDYGRALERAGDYGQALRSYEVAVDRAGAPDATLVRARDRMRYRLTPEIAAGLVVRSDPTTTTERLFAGAAQPFGSRHLVSMILSHDAARGGWPVASTSVSAVAASLVLGARWGGTLLLGGQVRGVTQVPSSNGVSLQSVPGLRWGGLGEIDTPIGSPVRLNLRGELENQWTEAPIAIRESGSVNGLTGTLFVYPIPSNRRLIINTGTQARRIMLAPNAALAPRPLASQLLAWAGADFVMWQDPTSTLRGQILDERMVRPSEVAGSITLSFRHYELFGRSDPDFASRIALVDRSTIDNGSLVVRNALGTGRFGFELRTGLGYESTRRNVLAQGGLSLYATGSAASRATLSYDIAQETTTGLTGRRHTGWVAYHVDL